MKICRVIFALTSLHIFPSSMASAEIIGPQIKRISSEQEMIDALSKVQIKNNQNQIESIDSIIHNGKPTLVTLWAHWCLNCVAEIKGFRAVSENCPNEWNIVFVSARPEDYMKDYIKFSSFKLPWNIYRGPELGSKGSSESKVSSAFYGISNNQVVLTPLHYLLSKEGKVEAIINAKFDLSEPARLAAFCGSDK